MAFSTLDAVRTGKLNVDLGLTGDSDDRFGTTAIRNQALQDALYRLWPRMARLTRETITISLTSWDYTLTTLRDVVELELTDSTGYGWHQTLDNFTTWYDEEDATPVVRLRLPALITDSSYILKAIGYAPYTVPASSPPSSSGSLDLQPEDEWIIVAGARAFLYRRQLNSFVTYERHENENRKTFLSPEQLLTMATSAEREFEEAIRRHPRRLVRSRRATPVR